MSVFPLAALGIVLFCYISMSYARPVETQLKPALLEDEIQEDEFRAGSLVNLEQIKETFSSLLGESPSENLPDENRCQGSKQLSKSNDVDADDDDYERDEYIDSMKESLDKWNSLIDSMNESSTDYDMFSELFGGEENKT